MNISDNSHISFTVIPAKAGIQTNKTLDSRLTLTGTGREWNDGRWFHRITIVFGLYKAGIL